MKLGDVLELTMPDGFHEMNAEEKNGLNFWNGVDGQCISYPEKHIIITVGFKKLGMLTSKLVSEDELVKKMEKSFECQPDYCSFGVIERNAGGKGIKEISYSYTAKDTPMFSESLVIKSGKNICYFHFYTRAVLKDDNIKIWLQMLEGIHWIS